MASDTDTKTKSGSSGAKTAEVRTRLAQVVEVAFTLIAAILVLAAILVAVRNNINPDNPLVKLVLNIADAFDGPFSRVDGIVQFHSADSAKGAAKIADAMKSDTTRDALVNWGIAAAVYLVVGRIAGKIIRP